MLNFEIILMVFEFVDWQCNYFFLKAITQQIK